MKEFMWVLQIQNNIQNIFHQKFNSLFVFALFEGHAWFKYCQNINHILFPLLVIFKVCEKE